MCAAAAVVIPAAAQDVSPDRVALLLARADIAGSRLDLDEVDVSRLIGDRLQMKCLMKTKKEGSEDNEIFLHHHFCAVDDIAPPVIVLLLVYLPGDNSERAEARFHRTGPAQQRAASALQSIGTESWNGPQAEADFRLQWAFWATAPLD